MFRVSEDGDIEKRIVATDTIDGELRTVFKYRKKDLSRFHTLRSMGLLREIGPEEAKRDGELAVPEE